MGPSQDIPLPKTPNAPALPPLFGMMPGKKKPKAQSMQQTFLGSEAQANPTNTGQKTLLGQ